MFKRILVMATLVCALPAMANAWSLNTWAKSGGGNIVVGSGAAQTSAQGSVFASYTTTNTVAVAVTAAPGYTISKVTQNGVVTTGPVSPYNTTVAGPTAQSVFATFKASTVSVTATCGAGGSVSPRSLGNIYYGQTALAAIKFVFTPKTGFAVGAISGAAGFTVSAPAANGSVSVTIPKGFVFTSAVALSASPTSTSPVANAGAPQTVLPNTLVTLSGAASTGTITTYTWAQTSGPAVTLTPATSNATFTPTVAGVYTFSLTVNGGSTATTSVTVTSSLAAAIRNACINCHNANGVGVVSGQNIVYNNWSASQNKIDGVLCYNCHVGANAGAHPGTLPFTHVSWGLVCSKCHNDAAANGDRHNVSINNGPGCIDCHAVPQNANTVGGPSFVNDNSGVRAIVGVSSEFNKRSHHITGAAPTDAQCSVCHLEGKPDGQGGISVNFNYHMKDAKIHLRNADDNSDMAWDGTNHTTMDNFCFSCHDSNGATAIPATFAGVTGFTGTASNPFGDTLTNGYDQVARAGVVDVKTAFTTTNASHHAVSGQRYKYRFSTLANAAAWALRTGNPVPAASDVAEGHTDLDGNAIAWTGNTYDPTGPEEGGEATLYEGGKFVSTYTPLGASLTVGDNSTLHCGDCHTVGQWKAGSSTNADGSATTAAIGAHGSANEYLLRNSLGTDAIHNSLSYVCFNCHATGEQAATAALWAEKVAEGKIAASVAPPVGPLNPLGKYIPAPVPTWKAGWTALHPVVFAGQFTGYATSHAVSAMHIQCVADSADNIGPGPGTTAAGRLGASWYAAGVKTLDYVPAAGATAAVPATSTDSLSGNITGIACTNCHNSGLRSAFGGIHGGNNTYTDGLGRTQTTYRFMPGMGNYRYAPPGGWDGKDVSDPTLLTVNHPVYPGTPGNRSDQSVGYPGPNGKPMGGCYTNGSASGSGGTDPNNGYSSCSHHGTSTAATQPGGTHVAPGIDDNFRANYGGGTTGNPTTFEPTVREATAGGTLVTRPLKY